MITPANQTTVTDRVAELKRKHGIEYAEAPQPRKVKTEIVLPPEAADKVRAAKANGQIAWGGPLGERPFYPNCPNCNDTGYLSVTIAIEGPLTAPPNSITRKATTIPWDNPMGFAWFVVETFTYACHVCESNERRVEYLRLNNGLLQNEQNWKLAYLAGHPDKEFALQVAQNIAAQNPPKGLTLFYGDYGVGKTGILKALVANFTSKGLPARYITAADYLGQLRASYGQDATVSEAQITRLFSNLAFLAVDEIDRVSTTDWAKEQTFTLIDSRYANREQTATVFATNAEPNELWPYAASRLTDGLRVLVAGKTLRGLQQ